MSTRPESMGIYADLAAKRAAEYDTALEGRVREWMESVLGHQLTGGSFREACADGVAVCELLNKLKPGGIGKIHRTQVMMFRRENFGSFQRGCVELGLDQSETAVYEDVADDRNMGLFLTNIIGLARVTQWEAGYEGPMLADAPKPAGPVTVHPTGGHKYIPSIYEEAAAVAGAAKAHSRHVEHGIISEPDVNPRSG
jgi:hypothetical protein